MGAGDHKGCPYADGPGFLRRGGPMWPPAGMAERCGDRPLRGGSMDGAPHGYQSKGKTLAAAWREAERSGRKREEAGFRLLTTTPSLPALAVEWR